MNVPPEGWYRALLFPVTVAAALTMLLGCSDRSDMTAAHVRVQLISEVSAITPGQSFWVGLVQTVDPGWHTYWRNPGDSGAATRITLDLNDDWLSSPIQWPAPERMPFGDLVNYGYTGQVLLLKQITPPHNLGRGRLKLTAEAFWLVCADVCIPGEAELTLRLPVRIQPDAIDAETAPLFERSRAMLPTAASEIARAVREDGHITITVHIPEAADAEWLWYFPHASDAIMHAANQENSVTAPNTVELIVKPKPTATNDRVDGVVVVKSSGNVRSYAIDVPIAEGANTHD